MTHFTEKEFRFNNSPRQIFKEELLKLYMAFKTLKDEKHNSKQSLEEE